MRSLNNSQSGSVLIAIIVMLPAIIMIAAVYTQLAISGTNLARRDQSRTYAQMAADAGVDAAMEQINNNESWAGSGSELEVQNDGKIRTTLQTTVTDVGNAKSLVSVGKTYRPSSSTSAVSRVSVTVGLRAVESGRYSVVSGVGGLFMRNSSKILGGDVLINGEVQMSNTAQIGMSSSPVTMKVAHQTCPSPANATYPQICANGENGQPITISNSARIYGSVTANNQTQGQGMDNPGLVGSSGVAAQALPSHDRNLQKTNITSTVNTSYYTSCAGSNQRTWPGRLKIVGDVTISNSCTVTLDGDVWITGNLTLQNSGKLITKNGISLGGQNTVNPNLPTVMIDGSSGASLRNSSAFASNTSSVGMQVITYASRASCSPDCADVTGPALYNSRLDKTIQIQNQGQAPNTILYARWTQAELSNGGSIGAVVGQTVSLTNSATITFGVSAGNVLNRYWVIDDYRRTR